jgi:hypothetical protein
MSRLVPLLMLLSGCAHYGNFSGATAGHDGQMAHDTAKAMRVAWPPSDTALKADVLAPDPFFGVLVENLRNSGYSVAPPNAEAGSELRYIVDRVGDAHYRVSVLVDGHSLSRLYETSQGQLRPASAWARQE